MQFYFHVILSLSLHIFWQGKKKRLFSKGAFSDSYKAKNKSALSKTTFEHGWLSFASYLEKLASWRGHATQGKMCKERYIICKYIYSCIGTWGPLYRVVHAGRNSSIS